MVSRGLVAPKFVYWDDLAFCEVLDVSLVICWLLWFVSVSHLINEKDYHNPPGSCIHLLKTTNIMRMKISKETRHKTTMENKVFLFIMRHFIENRRRNIKSGRRSTSFSWWYKHAKMFWRRYGRIFFLFIIFSIFFFSFSIFIFCWIPSSLTCWGLRGHKINLWPWIENVILLLWPSWKVLWSYCQGLPRMMCPISIGTMSQKMFLL